MAIPPRSGAPSLWLLNLLTLIEPLDQYIHEVKKIAAAGALELNEKMKLLQETSGRLSREMEGRFEALANQLEERKKELLETLNPVRPDLTQAMQRLLTEIGALAEKVALREKLRDRWQAQTPAEILNGYEQSLAAGDEILREMFDAYAEDVLKAKGHDPTLAAFRERREKAKEVRLTPAQTRARQELQELEKLETSMRLISLVVTSTLRAAESGAGGGVRPQG